MQQQLEGEVQRVHLLLQQNHLSQALAPTQRPPLQHVCVCVCVYEGVSVCLSSFDTAAPACRCAAAADAAAARLCVCVYVCGCLFECVLVCE